MFRDWTPEMVAAHNARTKGKSSAIIPNVPKATKYRNQKVEVDGNTFDSKKEGSKYRQLKMLESAGKISNLRLQVPFELAPAVTIHGKRKRALTYISDFCYTENGVNIVLDVKSEITKKLPVYRVKIHLMKHIHGIDVMEA